MVAPDECQVLAHVATVGLKSIGFVKLASITVAGPWEEHHGRAGRDRYVPNLGRCSGQPEVGLDGTFHSQGLFQKTWDEAPVLTQCVLEVRVLGDDANGSASQFCGRLR